MNTIAIVLMLGLALVAIVPAALAKKREQRAQIQSAARQLGLRARSGGWFEAPSIGGERAGLAVRVEYFHKGSNKQQIPWTRFVVGGLPPDLVLRTQGFGKRLLHRVLGEDFLTGDTEFDDLILVKGDPAMLPAQLGEGSRMLIRRHAVIETVVTDGVAKVEVRDHIRGASDVGGHLARLSELVRELAVPLGEVPGRIAQSAVHDPCPAFRRLCLATLDAHHSAPVAASAAQQALTDPDALVRLQSALVLGDDARDVLLAGSPEELRTFAAFEPERLARALLRARREDLLLELLQAPGKPVRIGAMHALARIGTAISVEPLGAFVHAGFLGDSDLRSTAQQTVASIQARLVHADVGQISIAAEGGEVSIAAQAGAVSVVKGST